RRGGVPADRAAARPFRAEAPGLGVRRADLPRDRRAVVSRGIAGEPRVRALLLHPRAFRALPHARGTPRAAVVVLPADRRFRVPAVELRAARGDPRGVGERGGTALPAAARD